MEKRSSSTSNAQHSVFQHRKISKNKLPRLKPPLPSSGDALGVRQLVQVEHGTHLVHLAVALADDAAVVADHEVAEVFSEVGRARLQEAASQLQQADRPQVSQSESLGHGVFQPPVGPLFLVGFRQIQVVLPDVLHTGKEEKQPLSLAQSQQTAFCLLTDAVINHRGKRRL